MALPPEIITARVDFGPFIDDAGVPYQGSATFSSSGQKVWAATGTPIIPRPIAVPLDADGKGSIELPVNDQAGYTDGQGRAVTGWTYSVAISLSGGPSIARRNFSLQAGGNVGMVVDLDLMVGVVSTTGVTVELPTVLSVNGMTGHVEVTGTGTDGGTVTVEPSNIVGITQVGTDLIVAPSASSARTTLQVPHINDSRFVTSAERTKLAGVADGATANRPDTELLARSNHIGLVPTANVLSDYLEVIQDALGVAFSGGNVVASYDDASGTISLTATTDSAAMDPEAINDAIGAAIIGVGVVTVTFSDEANTVTISSTATANSTDAFLRDRANHTGSQPISTVTNLQATLDSKAVPASLTYDVVQNADGTWPAKLPGYRRYQWIYVTSTGQNPPIGDTEIALRVR